MANNKRIESSDTTTQHHNPAKAAENIKKGNKYEPAQREVSRSTFSIQTPLPQPHKDEVTGKSKVDSMKEIIPLRLSPPGQKKQSGDWLAQIERKEGQRYGKRKRRTESHSEEASSSSNDDDKKERVKTDKPPSGDIIPGWTELLKETLDRARRGVDPKYFTSKSQGGNEPKNWRDAMLKSDGPIEWDLVESQLPPLPGDDTVPDRNHQEPSKSIKSSHWWSNMLIRIEKEHKDLEKAILDAKTQKGYDLDDFWYPPTDPSHKDGDDDQGLSSVTEWAWGHPSGKASFWLRGEDIEAWMEGQKFHKIVVRSDEGVCDRGERLEERLGERLEEWLEERLEERLEEWLEERLVEKKMTTMMAVVGKEGDEEVVDCGKEEDGSSAWLLSSRDTGRREEGEEEDEEDEDEKVRETYYDARVDQQSESANLTRPTASSAAEDNHPRVVVRRRSDFLWRAPGASIQLP